MHTTQHSRLFSDTWNNILAALKNLERHLGYEHEAGDQVFTNVKRVKADFQTKVT